MAYLYATFDGANLPIQFSYVPYIPQKRNTVTPTANCVVVQAPKTSQIVHGEGGISWTIEACKPDEFYTLWGWYNTTSPILYSFVGYWGDQYEVYFTQLDEPRIKSRLFSASGFFQVMCETQTFQSTGDRAMKCEGGFV
jgi:hypothetical protein